MSSDPYVLVKRSTGIFNNFIIIFISYFPLERLHKTTCLRSEDFRKKWLPDFTVSVRLNFDSSKLIAILNILLSSLL